MASQRDGLQAVAPRRETGSELPSRCGRRPGRANVGCAPAEAPEAAAAIRASGYRDAAHFRPLLIAAQEQYAGNDGIQGEIRAILRRWK